MRRLYRCSASFNSKGLICQIVWPKCSSFTASKRPPIVVVQRIQGLTKLITVLRQPGYPQRYSRSCNMPKSHRNLPASVRSETASDRNGPSDERTTLVRASTDPHGSQGCILCYEIVGPIQMMRKAGPTPGGRATSLDSKRFNGF